MFRHNIMGYTLYNDEDEYRLVDPECWECQKQVARRHQLYDLSERFRGHRFDLRKILKKYVDFVEEYSNKLPKRKRLKLKTKAEEVLKETA